MLPFVVACGRPRALRAWDACVESNAAIEPKGADQVREMEGDQLLLTIAVDWGLPALTKTAGAHALIPLPSDVQPGMTVTVDGELAYYSEMDEGVVFRSRTLTGTVQVTDLASDHLELWLDVRAVDPLVDVRGQSEVRLVGRVRADRQPFMGCLRLPPRRWRL